jgi:formylglycine-generating enzyme required for sulfatase activity
MVMTLVPGETLEARLRRDRVLPQAAVEQILNPLLEGLQRVHEAGFLHRDIKPANILIDPTGRPTLIDFGASRAALQGRTQRLTAVYTPGYAAFEQFTSARQGPWTDIYALGATLYHCIVGQQPPSAIERQQHDTLVRASQIGKGRYAPSLLRAIDAALKLKAAERPQSIAEWRHVLSGTASSMMGEPIAPEIQRMDASITADASTGGKARVRWPIWLAVGVVVLSLAGGGFYIWQWIEETTQKAMDDAWAEGTQPYRDCRACPAMARIPSGSFMMGSPPDESDRLTDEGPQHRVTIGYAFSLGKYEVTRGEFEAFVQATGRQTGESCYTRGPSGQWGRIQGKSWRDPGFTQTARHPVVCVSWDDAKAYVAWLSQTTGKKYRLPTEAEWEYAARTGTTTARYWGGRHQDACQYANVDDALHDCRDGYAQTAPVGKFQPNRFGLYDLLGNVWELTEDCSHWSYTGAPSDGSFWLGDCSVRMRRGGAWDGGPGLTRAAARGRNAPGDRNHALGFRVARTD